MVQGRQGELFTTACLCLLAAGTTWRAYTAPNAGTTEKAQPITVYVAAQCPACEPIKAALTGTPGVTIKDIGIDANRAELIKLSHARMAMVPAVGIMSNGEVQIVTNGITIDEIVHSRLGRISDEGILGRLSLLLFGILFLHLTLGQAAGRYGAAWTLLLLGSAALLSIATCAKCSGTLTLLGFPLPLWGVAIGVGAAIALSWGTTFAGMLGGALCAAAIAGQCYALWVQPKVCIPCSLVLLATLQLSRAFDMQRASLPVWRLQRSALALVCSPAILLGFVNSGITQKATGSILPVPNLNAMAISSVLRNEPPGVRDMPTIYLIELAGCSSCDKARSALATAGLRVRRIQRCASNANVPCWPDDKYDSSFPIVLVVDTKGVILDYVLGWPKSDRQSAVWTTRIKRIFQDLATHHDMRAAKE